MDIGSIYNKSKLTLEVDGMKKPERDQFPCWSMHFLDSGYIKDGFNVLDIGGAGGAFVEMIKKDYADIDATVLDPDLKCIEYGKKQYPHFNFIHGIFPDDLRVDTKFDVVSMMHLFPQLPNWKDILLSMQKCAKKYIAFTCVLKLRGTTVIDRDVSYVYGLDSGERLHQIVHNINEIMNFMSIHEMRVKKINFLGNCASYCFDDTAMRKLFDTLDLGSADAIKITPALYIGRSGHAFRSEPAMYQIKGSFILDLFDEEENPKRFGGGGERKLDGYNFFEPEKDIRFLVNIQKNKYEYS